MAAVLVGALPSWVEVDPLRSRATDALGLQAVADRLADRLLPGLSVLTGRARYFTFLCWARQQVGRDPDERGIHRLEIALALAEASISDGDPGHAKECAFVGRRNVQPFARDRVPRDPRSVYKVPAWRAYRPSLIALGLLKEAPKFELTGEGALAAKLFRNAVRPRGGASRPLPEVSCLSNLSRPEIGLLRRLVGLSQRGRLDANSENGSERRGLFAREVSSIFREQGLSPETVLPHYEGRQTKTLPEPAATLRIAAVWERLSLGLNILFTAWVRGIEAGRRQAVEREIASKLGLGLRCPALAPVKLKNDEGAIAKGVACLREAVRRYDDLHDRGVTFEEAEAFDLARSLLRGRPRARARVEEVVAQMLARHRQAKGDEAWVRTSTGDGLELARDPGESWAVSTEVQLHAYRMRAFDSVARDLDF